MSKNRYEQIADIAEDIAQSMAKSCFYGNEFARVNKDDRKKLSHKHLLELSRQTGTQAMAAIVENMYCLIREIKEDESVSKDQKFDLVWGEIELLLIENVKWFAKRYDPYSRLGSITIEEVRSRYKMGEEVK